MNQQQIRAILKTLADIDRIIESSPPDWTLNDRALIVASLKDSRRILEEDLEASGWMET